MPPFVAGFASKPKFSSRLSTESLTVPFADAKTGWPVREKVAVVSARARMGAVRFRGAIAGECFPALVDDDQVVAVALARPRIHSTRNQLDCDSRSLAAAGSRRVGIFNPLGATVPRSFDGGEQAAVGVASIDDARREIVLKILEHHFVARRANRRERGLGLARRLRHWYSSCPPDPSRIITNSNSFVAPSPTVRDMPISVPPSGALHCSIT